MIDKTVGMLVMVVLGLMFMMFTTDQGITKGAQELGQKIATQLSTIESDPNNGTASVPEMRSGSSSVDILK